MTTRRSTGQVFAVLILFSFITLLAGCASKPDTPKWIQSSQNQGAQPTVPKETQKKVDQMDANAGSADALAQKTSAYAKQMAPVVQARTANSAAPSSVQWIDGQDAWPDGSSLRLDGTAAHDATGSATPIAPAQQTIQSGAAGANLPAGSAPIRAETREVAMATPVHPAAVTSVDSLSDRLSAQIKDQPRDVWAQTEFQMLKLLKDEPAPDLSALSALPPEDRELVGVVLDGLSNFRNALRADNNMMLSGKIRPLLEMSERLRSQAELTVPTIALCSRVNGFGNYDAIDPARFDAGVDHQVIVYCEVGNFLSNLNEKQLWETKLTWDMTLYTAEDAIPVWSDKTDTIADASHVRRHDFFVVKKITLPKALPIGRYLLKVTIVDTQSNHVAEATTPLVVAAH